MEIRKAFPENVRSSILHNIHGRIIRLWPFLRRARVHSSSLDEKMQQTAHEHDALPI